VDASLQPLASIRVPVSRDGYRALRRFARQWPIAGWAIEGAGGVGAPLTRRLRADGIEVIDVPAKLAARVRVLSIGHGRKNDDADALSVGLVTTHCEPVTKLIGDVAPYRAPAPRAALAPSAATASSRGRRSARGGATVQERRQPLAGPTRRGRRRSDVISTPAFRSSIKASAKSTQPATSTP
jgi:hypothetical protein